MTFKSHCCCGVGPINPRKDTSGHFVDLQLGQKAAFICCSGSFLPRQSTTWKPHIQRGLTEPQLASYMFLFLDAKGPSESWWEHFCSKNRACCYCRPLFSNPLLHFSQCRLHLFPQLQIDCPCLFALPCCSFIYAQTRYAQKWFSIQSPSLSLCLHVVCLPRGLDSCRYGGAVGVTFSELGPDSRGDRSSMPSEAMFVHRWAERNDGGEAPGCTEASLSTEEQPAAGCWCRVAPVQQPRWRQPGGGRSSAVIPAPSLTWPGAWVELWDCVYGAVLHIFKILWWNFVLKLCSGI